MTEAAALSRAERYRQGKRLRLKTPLGRHAELAGSAARDPVAILAAGDRTRVPELVPVRYERMLADPFHFLRGAAAVMAEDLAQQPVAGIPVQACGDCHVMNFGAFATPEQNILFDINDFDETLPGVDFTADIKRLCASVAVAARAANLSKKRARTIAAAAAEAYRRGTRILAELSPLEIWHSRIDLAAEIKRIEDRALRRKLGDIVAKARSHLAEDDNFPHLCKGEPPRIEDRPPLIYHFTRKRDAREHVDAERVFASYRKRLPPERRCLVERYALKDVAFKVVGVGSVGTFCAVGLFMSGDGAPLFLQIKEAGKSVLERLGPKCTGHQGKRVVEGQRVMQAASDIFLLDRGRGAVALFLRAAPEESAAWIGQRAGRGGVARQLRAPVRTHLGAGARARRRRRRARRLYGKERRVRRRARLVCDGVRRAHATRLRSARSGEAARQGEMMWACAHCEV
jgi:uncharacterized protein (DUF2252 family)